MLKRTPLFEAHKACGAKFTSFGGWEMPVQYTGVIEEHKLVRSSVGLFDVSHMGEIVVKGKSAKSFLQYVCSNDIGRLSIGNAQYSLFLNEHGGVVDDLIIYMLGDNEYLLCVNASNTDKDYAWLMHNNNFGAELINASPNFAQLAIQGPASSKVIAKVFARSLADYEKEWFPCFSFRIVSLFINPSDKLSLLVARTGYTGEDGFEIFYPAKYAIKFWDMVLNAGKEFGIKPVGLAARDTLRLEACYPLHGHESSDNISALSSQLSWVIKFEKGDFIGRSALLEEKKNGSAIKLVGLEVIGLGIIREGVKLFDSGNEIGWVSSGTKTPTVNKAIGLGFVQSQYDVIGKELEADVRGKLLKVKVVKRPFYKKES